MIKRILVVEDQPDNRRQRAGLKLTLAINSDHRGHFLCTQRGRKEGAGGRLVMIMVPKPFSPRQLLAKIRQYLSPANCHLGAIRAPMVSKFGSSPLDASRTGNSHVPALAVRPSRILVATD
jgi:hypothetical protein